MNWRIHVSNHTIRHLEILRGDPSLLAAWTQPNRVECFHLLTGTSHGFCEFSALPTEDDFHDQEWRTYLEPTDDGPWRTRLTKLMLQRLTIYRTEDGRIRLVHFTGGRLLWIGEEDDRALTFAEDLVVIDLDRTSGRAATLNSGGRLDIYQCGDLLSSFDIGLRINPFEAAGLAICGDGEKVYLTDGPANCLPGSTGIAHSEDKYSLWSRRDRPFAGRENAILQRQRRRPDPRLPRQ